MTLKIEVGNVKWVAGATQELHVQLKTADREPQWLKVTNGADSTLYKMVVDSLEKRRPVLAKISGDVGGIKVDELDLTFADPKTS